MKLGLDIGGTKLAGVLLSPVSDVVDARWVEHEARGIDQVVKLMCDMIGMMTSGLVADEVTVGVSVAGLVGTNGRVTRRGVLDLQDADIAGELKRGTGFDVSVSNDADSTLRAATEHDPDQPVTDAVLLALGTGVAGAVIWQGQPIRGQVGLAGELGHLPVLAELPYVCVCGGFGCLEQYASGRGLSERAVSVARSGAAVDLLTFAGCAASELTSVHVVAAARAGVPTAVALINDAADAVAQALISVAVTTEPAKVYLGGSVGHAAADLLLPRISSTLARRWPFAATWSPPPVVLDNIGPQAAAIGAALLASDQRDLTPLF